MEVIFVLDFDLGVGLSLFRAVLVVYVFIS